MSMQDTIADMITVSVTHSWLQKQLCLCFIKHEGVCC